MKETKMFRMIILLLLCQGSLFAQSVKQTDEWGPLKYFVGKWEGSAKGEPGTARVEREYRFVLNGKFLYATNKSAWAPTEKNKEGEVHQDWGFFSRDRFRKCFVLRQFHVEGFVNQYVSDATRSDSGTFVFTTEAIENIPADWNAREIYTIFNADEFVERFELAEPGKEYTLYSESRFKRTGQ